MDRIGAGFPKSWVLFRGHKDSKIWNARNELGTSILINTISAVLNEADHDLQHVHRQPHVSAMTRMTWVCMGGARQSQSHSCRLVLPHAKGKCETVIMDVSFQLKAHTENCISWLKKNLVSKNTIIHL